MRSGGNSKPNPPAKFRHSCAMRKLFAAELSSRWRPAPAIARGKRPDRRYNLFDQHAEGAAPALPVCLLRSRTGRRPARSGSSTVRRRRRRPASFESAAGRIRPGRILEAPDLLQSESNRQRSLGQTKSWSSQDKELSSETISRTEIHSGLGRTVSNKVRFPSQSASAERICRPFSLSAACGHSFGQLSRHGGHPILDQHF